MHMPEKYSSPSAYLLSILTTFFGVFSLNEWALITGIFCTLSTFLVNWYYRRKEFLLRIKVISDEE